VTTFYLGTHEPSWLERTWVPLFVSHRRLRRMVALPRARGPWALDSGGFSELGLYGRWETSPAEYVDAVARYQWEIGRLEWAAPQDWMCEPVMLAKTGLTLAEHQRRTVESYLELRARAPGHPWIPVLQGWTEADYMRCVELYAREGVDLTECRRVGLGSVCRRQATREVGAIAYRLFMAGIHLHAFGVKASGLHHFALPLVSADSMAWSFQARRSAPLPGHRHRSCANCLEYALGWRYQLTGSLVHGAADWCPRPSSHPRLGQLALALG